MAFSKADLRTLDCQLQGSTTECG